MKAKANEMVLPDEYVDMSARELQLDGGALSEEEDDIATGAIIGGSVVVVGSAAAAYHGITTAFRNDYGMPMGIVGVFGVLIGASAIITGVSMKTSD